jgi:hypothetical protein
MKKIYFLVFLLISILCRSVLIAQESSGTSSATDSGSGSGTFTYGFHLGPTISGFTHYWEIFSEYKTGILAGAFGEYAPNPLLGFSVEANYAMTGGSEISPYLIYPESLLSYRNGTVLKSSSDITLHTVEIPLFVNFRPLRGNVIPTLSLGYSVDFIFKAWSQDMIMTSGSYPMPLVTRSTEDVTSAFENMNQNIIGGIGVEFHDTKLDYAIQVRYKVGMMNINGLAGLNYINHQYDFSVNTFTVLLSVKMK